MMHIIRLLVGLVLMMVAYLVFYVFFWSFWNALPWLLDAIGLVMAYVVGLMVLDFLKWRRIQHLKRKMMNAQIKQSERREA